MVCDFSWADAIDRAKEDPDHKNYGNFDDLRILLNTVLNLILRWSYFTDLGDY
jgi:hypothetical protein